MILFVGATPRELGHFYPGGQGFDFQAELGQCAVYRGQEICFLACGVGPLNAALSLQRCLLSRPGIKLVVNVGIAGSYDLELYPLGSVYLAEVEIWPEYGIRTGSDHVDPRALGFPLLGRGPGALWNRILLDPPDAGEYKDILCISPKAGWSRISSLTVAGASGSRQLARKLARRYQAGMENMEGFALAYVCLMHDVRFVEARSISNLAGSREQRDWDLDAAFRALKGLWTGIWNKDAL